LKNRVPIAWVSSGVPNCLLESVASDTFETAMLAAFLASKAGCCIERTVVLALVHETGGVGILEDAWREYVEKATLESKVARLAHELAVFLQARRYKRMGLDVDEILESALRRTLDVASEIGVEALSEAVHSLLTS